MLHKNIAAADNHVGYTWTYANASARTGAGGFVSGDVGKIAWQQDDDTFWILKATTPTWAQIGGNALTKATGAEVNTGTDDAKYVTAKAIADSNVAFLSDIPATPNVFSTIAVSGQSNVVADSSSDTLTLIAGTNITLTTDATGDSVTIAASGGATNLTYTASTRLLESSTGTDVTLPLVSSTDAGLAPATGGGTTNFLRADGTWAAPVASASITVKDEGSNLTTSLASLDFVGAGVTATNTGGAVTVTIPGGGAATVGFEQHFMLMGA